MISSVASTAYTHFQFGYWIWLYPAGLVAFLFVVSFFKHLSTTFDVRAGGVIIRTLIPNLITFIDIFYHFKALNAIAEALEKPVFSAKNLLHFAKPSNIILWHESNRVNLCDEEARRHKSTEKGERND